MRLLLTCSIAFTLVACVSGQDKDVKAAARFGINANLEQFPQEMPKDALASVLKAIESKKVDYLLAQLADPEFVDLRVTRAGGSFEDVVKETTAKLAAEPTALKEMRRFLQEGEWDIADAAASAQLKDVKDKRVFFKKVGPRWFLENRLKPAAEGK